MWSAIRWLALRLIALRWFLKLGWLALLVPIAMLLKLIGLPIIGVLSVIAVPVLALLLLFGLPIILVIVVGGLLMTALSFVLTIGVAAIKVGLFVVLPVWLLWMLIGKLWSWRDCGGDRGKPGERPDAPPTTPNDSMGGADPA